VSLCEKSFLGHCVIVKIGRSAEGRRGQQQPEKRVRWLRCGSHQGLKEGKKEKRACGARMAASTPHTPTLEGGWQEGNGGCPFDEETSAKPGAQSPGWKRALSRKTTQRRMKGEKKRSTIPGIFLWPEKSHIGRWRRCPLGTGWGSAPILGCFMVLGTVTITLLFLGIVCSAWWKFENVRKR